MDAGWIIIFGVLYLWLHKIREAIKYACNFVPVNRPMNVWVDKETKECRAEPITDQQLWWRCFWLHYRGKVN